MFDFGRNQNSFRLAIRSTENSNFGIMDTKVTF